jgi:hypothetical protein
MFNFHHPIFIVIVTLKEMIQINAFMQLSDGEDEFTKWFLNHNCAAVRFSNCAAGLKCSRPTLTKRCVENEQNNKNFLLIFIMSVSIDYLTKNKSLP